MPDDSPAPDAASTSSADSWLRLERRLKIADLVALIALALFAIDRTERDPTFKPTLLLLLGAYQIVVAAGFLFLVWCKRGTGVKAETISVQSIPDPRLRRWEGLTRRLPFQLDYVLRLLAGIALIIWGMLLRSP